MSFIQYPRENLTTAHGPVTAAFTNGGHVAVSVEAHVNDDKPALNYRGQDYIGMVHLFLLDGVWATRNDSDTNLTKRPNWMVEAPPTHRDALVAAIVKAVTACVEANPDILKAAEYASASNELDRLAGERQELRTKLDEVEAAIARTRKRRDASR